MALQWYGILFTAFCAFNTDFQNSPQRAYEDERPLLEKAYNISITAFCACNTDRIAFEMELGVPAC